MSFTVNIAGTDVTRALTSNLPIKDELNANCCTLTFSVQQETQLQELIGKPVEILQDGTTSWFYGMIRKQDPTATGGTQFTVYDPLFNFSRHNDDFYFKNQTATQIITATCEKAGVPLGDVANTEAVFPQLYYPNTSAEKVAVDALARTKNANGRKFWFRADPQSKGIILFERTVPAEIWVFKVGHNLTSATKSKSVVSTFTSVKLVNRETGQTVIKTNDAVAEEYNLHTQFFEEVNDADTDINSRASEIIEEKSKIDTSMHLEGINPGGIIPRLYTGDAIYVEDPVTGIVGGYYIRNITQTIEADSLVTLSMDIVIAPDLPEIQVQDADKITTDTGQTKETKKESETTVYVQPDGKIYHKATCPVIEGCNCHTMTKEAAKKGNLLQCAVCKA